MPSDSVDISVIVVTFNHAAFIQQALLSVIEQRSEFSIEIIVSDDASTDETCTLVSSLAGRYDVPVSIVRSDRNLGTNEVTTRALALARGRWVAVMDGDDYLTSPFKLQRQVEFLCQHPEAAACFHDVVIVDSDGRTIEPGFVRDGVDLMSDVDAILSGNYVPGSAAMFVSSALLKLPDWVATAPFGDWALFLAAAHRGKVGYLREILGAYRRHPGGQWSGLREREQLEGIIAFYTFMETRIWPEYVARTRHYRAAWRVNLWNALWRHGDETGLTRSLELGCRAGDAARLTRDGRDEAGNDDLEFIASSALTGEPVVSQTVPEGFIDGVSVSADGTRVIANGWARYGESGPRARLVVRAGEAEWQGAAVRLDRPDVARAVMPSLARSGFWFYLKSSRPICEPIVVGVVRDGRQVAIGAVAPPRRSQA